MNENIYETLEECLQAIETGADIESVLQRYPNMAEELRPILVASFQARSLAPVSVPEDAIRRGRARVLQHAAGMREAAQSSRQPTFVLRRLAVALVLVFLFFLSSTGLVRASDGALPGDNLYPVKRTWEDVRLILVFNPEGREELEDEFEQERLHEIDELLFEGRHETIEFAGMVTEQSGDQWIVSSIPVQITPESKLPAEPVTVGALIKVEGHTNIQGFVEADKIELLEPGISLSPLAPVEIEASEDAAEDKKSSVKNDNENNDDDDEEIKSLSDDKKKNKDENHEDNGKKSDDSSDDNDNSNRGPSSGDNDNDNDDDESDDEPDDD